MCRPSGCWERLPTVGRVGVGHCHGVACADVGGLSCVFMAIPPSRPVWLGRYIGFEYRNFFLGFRVAPDGS